jgi:hypothetical protein
MQIKGNTGITQNEQGVTYITCGIKKGFKKRESKIHDSELP